MIPLLAFLNHLYTVVYLKTGRYCWPMTDMDQDANDLDELEAATGDAPESEDGSEAISSGDGGMTELESAIEETKRQLAEEKDRLLRMYAEFDNYRKRAAREAQDSRKYANESLIRAILPVVDNLERAMTSAEATGDAASSPILEGVRLTHRDLMGVLEKFNVTPVQAMGEPFNPSFHEAVGQEPSTEHPDNIVIREYQKGYLLHERLVRPAMVVVSKAVAPAPPKATESADAAEDDAADPNET